MNKRIMNIHPTITKNTGIKSNKILDNENQLKKNFINAPRSYSNKAKELLSSSSTKPKPKVYFVGPITNKTNTINNPKVLNPKIIPKNSGITNLNIVSCQKMKQVIRNSKPYNKLLAKSLYVSYNNSSSSTYRNVISSSSSSANKSKEKKNIIGYKNKNGIKCIYGKKNNRTMTNNISISKSSSRNKSNLTGNKSNTNNSTTSFYVASKDSANNLSNKNLSHPKTINNGLNIHHKKSAQGFKATTIKHLSGNCGFKKIGIKFSKCIGTKNDVKNNVQNNKNSGNVKSGNLEEEISKNKFENFFNNKVVNNYYKNGAIKKVNKILALKGKIDNILKINKKQINIDDKENILIIFQKTSNEIVKSLLFETKIAGIKSASIYIYEILVQKLLENFKKIKIILKYYYDDEKKSIMKKPSIRNLKEILLKIIQILEKPNIKNKLSQEFIIHIQKTINYLDMNKDQVKSIILQYLEVLKGNQTIHITEINQYYEYGNILNDFSILKKNIVPETKFITKAKIKFTKNNMNHANNNNSNNITNSQSNLNNISNTNINNNHGINGNISSIDDLKDTLNECVQIIFNSYINIDGDYDILFYKIQQVKFKILQMDNKMDNNMISVYMDKKKYGNKLIEIKEQKNLFKKFLNELSNKIVNSQEVYNDKNDDIRYNLQYLEIFLIKNNVLYENFNEAIKNIPTKPHNKKNIDKVLYILNRQKNLNLDFIHFNILYDKYIDCFKNNLNIHDINNLFLLRKILIYQKELNNLHNKLNKILQNKELEKNFNEIKKYDSTINRIIKNINNSNSNTQSKLNVRLINNSTEKTYAKIISQFIKYDKDSYYLNNNQLKNNSDNISLIEKTLFKHLSQNENIANKNNINTNLTNSNLNNLLSIVNEYCETKSENVLLKIKDEIKKKSSIQNNKNAIKESIFPYPRLYFLDNEKREKIMKLNKVNINDILEYYSLINKNQKLEISLSHHNRNMITGIKIYTNGTNISINNKDYEYFKFATPVIIQSLNNNKNKNILSVLNNIYKDIDKEIENSLSNQLLISLSSFSKNKFHDWVNMSINQIIICTLSLIFTNEITNLLSRPNSKNKFPLKEYKLINQKYNQWLKEECSHITDIINKTNVILTMLSQMSIVDSLIKNDVADVTSFNWLKYIRHLWDKNKNEVIIECGGWANYQMKQLIPHKTKILLSPDTDKIFLFNSSCFREKSASIIKVINNKYNNNSYKEIFEEYCNIFWTNMINVNSYINSAEDMKRIFDVCTIDKSWIYIDNLDFYNINSNNNINNMVYFSKYIQTIQQEVILNDIKFNNGEKMFCIMGCINVDENVKLKCEYLKGSSRILNFIKPDIEFYLRTSMKIGNTNGNNINESKEKQYTELLLNHEKILRNKLNGFYYDYDFYNEYLIYLINNIKNIGNEKKNDLLFSNFLSSFYNKFFAIKDSKNDLDEKILIKYFDKNQILYDDERIKLCKYLYFYSNDQLIKHTVYLNGFGHHFIIKKFQDFYKEYVGKNFNELKNINIIYDNETQKNENNDEICKTFVLAPPKNKKLLRNFFNLINFRLKKMNMSIPDEFSLTLIDYINKFIKNNSNNTIYYSSICLFNNLLNSYLDHVDFKKKFNGNNTNNNLIMLFNIITDCLLISLGHEKTKIKSITEICNNVVQTDISRYFLQVVNAPYFYYDINNMNYKTFNNIYDYIKSYKSYIKEILLKNNNKYYFVFSEAFSNGSNNNIFNILDNKENYIITDDIDALYKKINNNYIKLFIGYDYTYHQLNINSGINNEIISSDYIKKKIRSSDALIDKYLYLLSFYDLSLLGKDELIFLYKIINNKSQDTFNINGIKNILFLIETAYKAFPKSNYYVMVDPNNFLKYIFTYQIIKNTNIYFNMDETQTISNNIYLDLSQNELKIKLLKELLVILLNKNKLTKIILMESKNTSEHNYINLLVNDLSSNELFEVSNMLNDIYNLRSEDLFCEKYPKNANNYSTFNKIFSSLKLNINIVNDNYYNSKLLIQYMKYNKIKENKLRYKCLSCMDNIFNNNEAKIHDVSILINNTLTIYKDLISNKDEYVNSKYHYYNSIYISSVLNENIYNSLLEKIYLSLSNHFLFSLLLTFEIMINNFEISVFEKNYAIDYIKKFYIFPSNNTIKFKYETETETFKNNFIKENAKKLIEFYTKVSKSIDNQYLNLLNSSLNSNNNKYFYTTSIKKINRDIDKLLYYITFVPDQSSSIFKYLINKYLLKIFNFGRYNINEALRKPTNKYNFLPITVKAFSSINIINFLCSLSAYFEISFYIVRDGNIYNNPKKGNIDFGYKYLIDNNLIQLIKDGITKGYWILICEKIDLIKFSKILWELFQEISINRNSNDNVIHENFKLFFDEKLILNDSKKAIEDMTTIVNIDNENVDDLEAAHDIWVNVLEEKLLSDSLMNETQKDVLEINDNGTSTDKSNLLNLTIKNNLENKTNNINKTNNSIVSIKSVYNNSELKGNNMKNGFNSKMSGVVGNNSNNDLNSLLSWSFFFNKMD